MNYADKYRLDDLERVIEGNVAETPYNVVDAARQLVANCRAHQKQDRSALLRMAGNVAAGLEGNATCNDWTPEEVAHRALRIARAILAEVDGGDA